MYELSAKNDRLIMFIFRGFFTVLGRVADSAGRAIEGATVSFGSEGSSMLTDEDGYWSIDGCDTQFIITVEKDGYAFKPDTVAVDGPTEILFSGGYSHTGSVVDVKGNAVSDALIAFGDGYEPIRTDIHGNWYKEGLSGTTTASVYKSGMVSIPVSQEISLQSPHSSFMLLNIGDSTFYQAGNTNFAMILAPTGSFPKGDNDDRIGRVEQAFWIAQMPTTYELWYEIYSWAVNSGYAFSNPGREGNFGQEGKIPTEGRKHPVTMVSWRDAIVWCNALSEFLQFAPPYAYEGVILKDATADIDWRLVSTGNSNGFRLPTTDEREIAARYQSHYRYPSTYIVKSIEYPEGSGRYWTPGRFASGASAPAGGIFEDKIATRGVAWYGTGNFLSDRTRPVGQKQPNDLGLYDMSGNVSETCFTRDFGSIPLRRIMRGGSYFNDIPGSVRIAYEQSVKEDFPASDTSFRIVQTFK